jgi:hypothetical protein
MIPDPDRPGYLIRDPTEWEKLLKQEAQKRMQIMIDTMKSRGVDYDPEPIIKKQYHGNPNLSQ